ncbi:hypothetical protein ABE65_005100 [Fictibacillus phosphorivorans]|uniref:Uncharacterized protein n=1 Tax=Fictibacillus phosphorivorans TaxID=1221500 RepID=A0A160IJF7_9BACL|nr:hypothetical protein [Fictibacillus phosphorivorans]ANC76218.1 hypothetical protein ABE65_005100 [Fictibacillus phosphorivorans]
MKKKRIRWILFGFALLFVMIIWVFPFSPFSLKKSIRYGGDQILVDDYKSELKAFKLEYESRLNQQKNEELIQNRTTSNVEYLLKMYELPWLVDNDSITFTQTSLTDMELEVKEAKDILINLAFQEEYSKSTKSYLQSLLRETLSLEKEIEELKHHSSLHSRSTIDRQLRNLHVHFISNFRMLSIFYKEYLSSIKEA